MTATKKKKSKSSNFLSQKTEGDAEHLSSSGWGENSGD